jgi:MOSC domain-containing protein YiiM
MNDLLGKKAYGPRGDPAFHLGGARLEAGFENLKRAPAAEGRLTLLVRRLRDGTRETPRSAELSAEAGLLGDAWSRRPPRDPNAQLTVMREDVAEMIANGQPLTLFGDNLFVDFDISEGNLPVATRVRIGRCLVEVTPEPHNGCKKFSERFGWDALRFTATPRLRHERLRGVHFRVIEPGVVGVGDPITVVSRG